MTFTSLWANDNWPTSRNTINTNFTTAQTALDTKVEFSWTAPAIWDMAVFDATDGLWVKKKVFTASQTLESDSNGQPISAAKGTAYNVNFWTSALTALEGNNDALYMKLAGTQTVTGDKTFTGTIVLPTTTTGVTQSAWNNSTKLATTAYVDAAVVASKNWVFTKNVADASTTQTIAHGLGRTPKSARFVMNSTLNQKNSQGTYNGSTTSTVYVGTSVWPSDVATTSTTYVIYWTNGTGGATQEQKCTCALDSTNITLTWTKVDNPTGNAQVSWEVWG